MQQALRPKVQQPLLQHLRHLLWRLTKDNSWTCVKSLGCLQLSIAVVGTALYKLEHQSQHHKPWASNAWSFVKAPKCRLRW